jgi:hypothetical protein
VRFAPLALALIALVLAAVAAGCGSDDSDDSSSDSGTTTSTSTSEQPTTSDEAAGPPAGDKGGKEGADAFVACFKEPGYTPIRNATARQPAEIIAEEKGYEVEGRLMNPDDGVVKSFFIQFFESEAEREKATRELDLEFGSTDVPEPLEKGAAAVTWVTKQARDAVGPAVERCLG